MQGAQLGHFLGALTIKYANDELPEVHKAVGRNLPATKFSLLAAFSWVLQVKLEHTLGDTAREAVLPMLTSVIRHAIETFGWTAENARAIFGNRLEGFDAASSDSEGNRLSNIVKYFVASCEKLRPTIYYDQLIPDPEQLEHEGLREYVNPEYLAAIKRLHREEGVPTYSLDFTMTTSVCATIMSIGMAVEPALAG